MSDRNMAVLDSEVAGVAASFSWHNWVMDKPTYTQTSMQGSYEVETSPGAREFHHTDGHGNRECTSIRVHHFWNGSASFYPDQPTEFPGVTVRVHIPAGRYDLQQKLAERFHDVIEEFLADGR